jgi:hypothetical protein
VFRQKFKEKSVSDTSKSQLYKVKKHVAFPWDSISPFSFLAVLKPVLSPETVEKGIVE